MKKLAIIISFILVCTLTSNTSVAGSIPGQISEGETSIVYRNVTVYAPAVASTDDGYVGVISTITVTIQSKGSGRVYVDTLPLTQVDMQGSARLAVKVASALVEDDKNCDTNPYSYDYFFVVRTSAPVIGGPSAGAIMTTATIALLENWTLDENTIMTGMVNPDGSIGPIGGIPQKIDAAASVGATRFLIPEGQGTYTELEGWTLVSKSVADYAMNNYGMEVVEIADINEAIENFTGYSFSYEESDSEITTEDYIESMKPLATNLLEEAKNAYNNATSQLENSSIPASFYRTEIEERLDLAKISLEESEDWYDQHQYYTSTSKSFQTLISARFVNYSCEYFEEEDESYIQNLLDEVTLLYNESSEIAKNAEVTDFISLQSVGAAQRRATEAKLYLDNLDTNFFTVSVVLNFFYDVSFIVERCNSINWWIGIGNHFNTTGDITNSTVETVALEYIDEAQQAVIYSNLILNELGSSSGNSVSYLNSASSLLESAQDDVDQGYPAAALFGALEALVKANLALELIGTNAENKMESAAEQASNSISKSRKRGVEPILAVSYYEYAESLYNESEFDPALIYYKYSGMIAGALGFTNTSTGASSTFVGIPAIKSTFMSWVFEQILFILLIFVLGLLGGLVIGILIGGVSIKKEERKPPKKRPPRVVYQNRERRYHYPNNQIPRSIRDYYKKNK